LPAVMSAPSLGMRNSGIARTIPALL
jgi:hypothetical protein